MSSPDQAIETPHPSPSRSRWLTLLGWLVLGVFVFLALRDFYYGAVLMNNPPSFRSKRFLLFMLSLPAWVGLYGYGLWAAWTGRWPNRLAARLSSWIRRVPLALRLLVALLLSLMPTYFYLYSSAGSWGLGIWSRLGAILLCALLSLAALSPVLTAHQRPLAVALALLFTGVSFTAAGWLNRVTAYPFSLSWSEGNRIYDYSMMFAHGRYDTATGGPVHTFISAGRQLLWSLPFLIPNAGIYLLRLWDALLWILPPMLLGWALAKGLPAGKKAWLWQLAFALWTFIFAAQGPIYAPLVVSALLVVIAVRLRSPLLPLGLLLVLLAGYYAQISRWTWAYAPGLWAGMLALLQIDKPSLRPARWKELARPVAFGLAGYVGGQFMPRIVNWASNGFASPLKVSAVVDPTASIAYQPLLWDRLLPNPTYPPGILFGTLWAGLPLCLLLVYLWRRRLWPLNGLQGLAALAVSLAFLAVGVVISVKIGGGSNLHNLDMFWLTILLLAGWALTALTRQLPSLDGLSARWSLALLLVLTLIGPVTYNAQYGSPLILPDSEKAAEALSTIQTAVAEANQKGEVLFIDQRQLLTFGDVQRIPLVEAYEKKVLMDRAMAENGKYFDSFHTDLANHRFVLIVTEPIRVSYINLNSTERTFAEENNSWVKWVSEPLLKYYQPAETFQEVGVQLLVPKP